MQLATATTKFAFAFQDLDFYSSPSWLQSNLLQRMKADLNMFCAISYKYITLWTSEKIYLEVEGLNMLFRSMSKTLEMQFIQYDLPLLIESFVC